MKNKKCLVLAVLCHAVVLSDPLWAVDIERLMKSLNDKDAEIRFRAAEELGQIAPKQGHVIEALRIALSDEDYAARGAAARALYRIGPEALKKANLMQHTGYDPIESRAAVAILEKTWNHIGGYYRRTTDSEEIVFCLYEEIANRDIVVADPFSAGNTDVDSTIRQLRLCYEGQEVLDGRRCDTVCSRADDVTSGGSAPPVRQWWIDQSHLLTRMVDGRTDGSKVIRRFSYSHINEALNFLSYTPDISYKWVCENRKMADPLDEGYSGRFIEVCDGTRGNVSAAWGSYGDKSKNTIGITNNGG